MNKIKSIFICAALSVGFASQVHAADDIIVEGTSFPGGFFIGMSRDEVNQLDKVSGNCYGDVQECSIASPLGDGYISFKFVGSSVAEMTTNVKTWTTTAGARLPTSPAQIMALYPNAVKEQGILKVSIVDAAAGYEYYQRESCYLSTCKTTAETHTIFQPKDGSDNGNTDDGTETISDISGAQGAFSFYTAEVSSDSSIKIRITGGSGDADLYVKKASQPTLSSYDCRPYVGGNEEVCELSGEGTYHIGLYGYNSFSGVSLEITK